MIPSSYIHVYKPSASLAAPPLLLLHGTGGNEHDLLAFGNALSPQSAVLSPRGDVNENGQARFFRRLAEGVFDLNDVVKRTHALADFIEAAVQAYALDAKRLTAVGFSNGANMAACLLLLRPEVLAHAVLFRPMVVLKEPAKPASLVGKRVLISSGERDPIVPADHPERLAELLRAGGANVDVQVHRASHGLAEEDLTLGRGFLSV